MKKIGFFINDISHVGGTERVSTMIANMLAKSYQVIFISMYQANNGGAAFPVVSSIPVINLYDSPIHGSMYFPITVIHLAKTIKKYGLDIVVDVDGILDLYTIPLKKLTGIKVISWEHFNFHQNPSVSYRKYSRQLAGYAADHIVTLTLADKKLYEAELKFRRCSISTIYNPLNLSTAEKQYAKNSTKIISAGRLTEQKGFDLLIEVASIVLPNHPNWSWTVYGEGPQRKYLEEKTREKEIANQLSFPGNSSSMQSNYELASFFVMTSRFEGFPMVLLEAKSHKLPVISFDCETGPSEMVVDGVNGYLVPSFSTNIMATKIEELVSDITLRESFSSHALDSTSSFSPDLILMQWKEVIDSL